MKNDCSEPAAEIYMSNSVVYHFPLRLSCPKRNLTYFQNVRNCGVTILIGRA